MSKGINITDISWVTNPDGTKGYTCNPIKGKCLHNCPYCYAEKMRIRFKQPAELSYHSEVFDAVAKLKKPSTIFIGSVYDLFGGWIPKDIITDMMDKISKIDSKHTLLLLTKNPLYFNCFTQYIELNSNIYAGMSVTGKDYMKLGESSLGNFLNSKLPKKFISYEPLIGNEIYYRHLKNEPTLKFIIIGCLNINGRPVPPDKGGTKLEWVLELLEAADRYKKPVFIKPELHRLYPNQLPIRRDLPYLESR